MKRILFLLALLAVCLGVEAQYTQPYYGLFYGNGGQSFIAQIETNNWVKLNGTETNFPSSTTAGIQEVWTIYTNSLPQNYGPTVSGIEYDFPATYTYISTAIVLSNNYPSIIRLHGCGQNASRLVFTGTNVGTNWLTITGQTTSPASSPLGAYPVTIGMDNIGFTATNNVTNVLIAISNYGWAYFNEVDVRSWAMMTNQNNGVSLSQNAGPGVPPALGGMLINNVGDHNTLFINFSDAGLAWGRDVKCDHFYEVESPPTFIGYQTNASGTPSFVTNSAWTAGSPYSFSPHLIRRGGIDTILIGGRDYHSGTYMFLIGCQNSAVRLYNYEEETGAYYGSFATSDSTIPTVQDSMENVTGLPITLTYMTDAGTGTSSSPGPFSPTKMVLLPLSGYGVAATNWGMNQVPNPFNLDTNGTVYGNLAGSSNYPVTSLAVSNSSASNFFAYFTPSNTFSTNYNAVYQVGLLPGQFGASQVLNVGSGFTVTGAGTAVVNGTYNLSVANIFALTNASASTAGYLVFTNTANTNVSLVFNEAGFANEWLFENGLGGGTTYYIGAGNAGKRLDPVKTASWTLGALGTNATPTVAYIGLATNYYSVMALAGELTYGTNVAIVGGTHGVTNTTSQFGTCIVVAASGTYSNFDSGGNWLFTNTSIAGQEEWPVGPNSGVSSITGGITSCKIIFQ